MPASASSDALAVARAAALAMAARVTRPAPPLPPLAAAGSGGGAAAAGATAASAGARAAAVKRAAELTVGGGGGCGDVVVAAPPAAGGLRGKAPRREMHLTAGGVRSRTEGAPALIAPAASLVGYSGQRGIDGGVGVRADASAAARATRGDGRVAPTAASSQALPPPPPAVAAALARSVLRDTPLAACVPAPLVVPPRRRARSAAGAALPTAGPGWFDMPSSALTPELLRDLAALSARGFLDPKRHYKTTGTTDEGGGGGAVGVAAGRRRAAPGSRFVQIGTVVEGAAEFYSARIPARARKATLVEQLLAADGVARYAARNYDAVRTAAESGGRAAYAKRKAAGRPPGLAGGKAGGFKRQHGGGRGGGRSKRGRF